MARYNRCPQCGNVKIPYDIDEQFRDGIMFGILYLLIVLIKWGIGLIVFVFYDLWKAICYQIWSIVIRRNSKYKWKCRNWFLENE
jgi:hypothetical protein